MNSRAFQRTIEDFTCLKCQTQVTGNGYTNHCPACLWSRHVDINPGDRTAECGGLMEPVGILTQGPYRILHRCIECGFERVNKVQADDDFSAVIRVAKQSCP